MTEATPEVRIDEEEAKTLVGFRRHLHAHPELSFEEEGTARFIEEKLEELGLSTRRYADTGVVAVVEGAHPGPTLAFRGDIDALPIEEESAADYCSTKPGVMHACGHDVHATLGLGLARLMVRHRDRLHGRVKFIFQPAEEASPTDAPIGAERMAQEGVLSDAPAVDAVFAFHCMPTLEVGKIGYTGGAVWAGSDLVEIEIRGQKTHAAYPHEGIDAALVAAQVLVALQTVTSRRVDARQSCVLSIGKLEAGNSYNIIADRAQMTGILRTLSDETTATAKVEIERIVAGVCAAMGAEGEVRFTPGARLTANDVGLESRTVAAMKVAVGAERLVPHLPQMGAEDFAAFSRRVPGCYLFLGVRNEDKGITHMIHTPRFDIDEDAISFGVQAMGSALLELGRSW